METIVKFIKLNRGLEVSVDDEDFDVLNKYKWTVIVRDRCLKENPLIKCYTDVVSIYRRAKTKEKLNRKAVILWRVIMNTPDNLEVDHIDGDKLNCCKSNLRNCTRSQNALGFRRVHRTTSRIIEDILK